MLTKLLGIRIFDVEASSRCNLRCQFCPRDNLPETGLMSGSTFERLLDMASPRATDTVSFVGIGEPTLNPQLPDFIRQTKMRCARTLTWVTTNGTLLTARLLEQLAEAGLDILDISFNGLDRMTYETRMHGAQYDTTLANIRRAVRLLDQTGTSMRLQINYVVDQETDGRREEIEQFWRARGITHFRPQHIHDRAGLLKMDGLTGVEERGLGGRSCQVFDWITFVSWRGDVLPCCHDIQRRHKLGNVTTHTWRDIVHARKAIKRRKRWPHMCECCTDHLRFSLLRELDSSIRHEVMRRIQHQFARWGFGHRTPAERDTTVSIVDG